MDISRKVIIESVIWKLMERVVTQGVQFIVQIILARLLFPEDYGAVTVVLVFVNIAGVLINGGLTTALIQKKESDINDFSSVLYFSLLITLAIYTLLFFLAPVICFL